MKITYQQLQEVRPGEFIAEASDLRFAPGEWPAALETEMGNRLPLRAVKREMYDGELAAVVYAQQFGCIRLKVYND